MATNREVKKDKLYKNVQFWIGDILRIFEEPPKNDSKNKDGGDVIPEISDKKFDWSSVKTFTVIGVVVGVRNEKTDPLQKDAFCAIEAENSNRPIVYGKITISLGSLSYGSTDLKYMHVCILND